MIEDPARPVALVTGSVRGIGLGVAKELAQQGWRTHVVWRSTESMELEERFPGRAHRADLCREAECRSLVEAVLEQDGRLDGVVHAVGEYAPGTLEETSLDETRRMVDSNFLSSVMLAEAARPMIRETGGSWVFFGSSGIESLRARRDAPIYVAAKTALLSFVRSLALEEAAFGVRVNMVSPGLVPHADAAESTKAYAPRVPLGRPGKVEDLAMAVTWLLSAEAGHVTGQNLDVAGGWVL